MELADLRLEADGDTTRLACTVTAAGRREAFWFAVERRHGGHFAADRYDGFVVGILLAAMERGEDIEVRGTLSERLHFALNHYYGALVATLLPGLRPVRVHAERLDPGAGRPRPAGVGTGFSAGIDSFAVLHDHFLREDRPGYRVTHLLFNNVGSHGERDAVAAARLFRQRYAAIRGYPAEAGLGFIAVDSNLSAFVRMNFEATHTPRNLAVPLALQGLFGRYYYASAFQYRDCRIGPGEPMATADPMAIPLLATETLDLLATGSQHSRVAKTGLAARVPGATRFLNVCANDTPDGRNCSACSKCCRTLLTLELRGELGAFAGVFDLGTWRRVRNRYVASQVLQPRQPSPLTREIREYAAATGYRFSLAQHLGAALNNLPGPLVRLGRSLRRRYLGGP